MDRSFVVREAELLQLQRHFDAISQGTPALVMVEGDFGIGKTTLLRQAIGLARARGMLVCEARGSDLEHHFAFGVARQLFEPVLSTMDSEAIAELRSEPCGPALDVILSHA